jgi:hypothetical protein
MSTPEPEETKHADSSIKESDPMDTAIKNLMAICNEVQDTWAKKRKEQPHWSICANKFLSSYVKVDDPDGFRDMFQNFHLSFWERYCVKIFSEDDEEQVNDTFFLDTAIFPVPGKKELMVSKKSKAAAATAGKSKSSWGKKPVLKGPVIYFSMEDEKSARVCIAIGEIYRVCVTLYSDMEKSGGDDADLRSLPARFLHAFYSVMLFANGSMCPGSDILEYNVKILNESVADVTAANTGSKDKGGPFGILKEIIAKFTGGKNPIIPGGDQVGKIVSDICDGDGMDNMKRAFTSVMGEVTKGGELGENGEQPNIGSVLAGISKGLTTPETMECFEKIQTQLNSLTGSGVLAPPTAEEELPTVEEGEGADEQD